MSIFGGKKYDTNIYGIQQRLSKPTDNASILLSLYDIVETIEKTIIDTLIPKNELGISPEVGFKNVNVKTKYSQVVSRNLYYKNGFSNLPDGSCDCRILRQLYQEHPILRQYSFELNEPKCCQ